MSAGLRLPRVPLWAIAPAAALCWMIGFLPQLVRQHRLLVASSLADLVAYALLTATLGGLAAGLRRDRPWRAAALAAAGTAVAALVGFFLLAGQPAAFGPLDTGLRLTALVTSVVGATFGITAALGPVSLRAPILAAPAVCIPTWLEGLFSAEMPQTIISALLACALVAVLVASVRRTVDVVSWLPAWIIGWLMQAVLTVLGSVGALMGQGHRVNGTLFTSRFLYFHDLWNQPAVHYPLGWALGGLLALGLVGYRFRDSVRL